MHTPVSGSRWRGRLLLLLITLLIAVGLNVAFMLPDAGAPGAAAQGPYSPALLIPDANGNDCGNHNCQENKGENCQTCPQDCGYCTPEPTATLDPSPSVQQPDPPPSSDPPGCVPHDGNGYCDPECEASWNAPLDCGPWCGDTVCADAERGTCVQDCGEVAPPSIQPIEPEITDEDQEVPPDLEETTDPDEGQTDDKSTTRPPDETDEDTPPPGTETVEPPQDEDSTIPAPTTTPPPSRWEKLVEMSKSPLFFVVVLIVVILFGITVFFLALNVADTNRQASEENHDRGETRVL